MNFVHEKSMLDIQKYTETSENMMKNAFEQYLLLYKKYDLASLNVTDLEMRLKELNVSFFIDLEFPPLQGSIQTKNIASDNILINQNIEFCCFCLCMFCALFLCCFVVAFFCALFEK